MFTIIPTEGTVVILWLILPAFLTMFNLHVIKLQGYSHGILHSTETSSINNITMGLHLELKTFVLFETKLQRKPFNRPIDIVIGNIINRLIRIDHYFTMEYIVKVAVTY